MGFKKILVPVDFSEFSAKAVEASRKIAHRYSGEMTILHVMISPSENLENLQDTNFQAYTENRKSRILQQFRMQYNSESEKEDCNIKFVTLSGISPADSICRYLKDFPHDLVVMGTHGQTGFRHFTQGSVVEKMIYNSPVPVLTINHAIRNAEFKRILAPIDFSIHSQKALDYVVSMAKHNSAKVVFLHVIEQEIYPNFSSAEPESVFEIDPALESSVLENLKDFVADTVDENFIENFVVLEGVVHKEIIEMSKQFDLLVTSTHGITGLEYISIGGTAEKVVRWASCPVLVVKRQ